MEKLIKEEDIEICKGCNAERSVELERSAYTCNSCGRDEDVYRPAVRQTIERILMK